MLQDTSSPGGAAAPPAYAAAPALQSGATPAYEASLAQPQSYRYTGPSREALDTAEKAGSFARDMYLGQQMVHVDGYERAGDPVREHVRQPPGGVSFGDKAAGTGIAVAVAVGAGVVDYAVKSWNASSAEAERKARAEAEAARQERFRQDMLERARVEEQKNNWWKPWK